MPVDRGEYSLGFQAVQPASAALAVMPLAAVDRPSGSGKNPAGGWQLPVRHFRRVLVLNTIFTFALFGGGCSFREEADTVAIDGEGFRFELASEMTIGSVWFASEGSAGEDCICHVAVPKETDEWQFLYEETFSYRNSVLNGARIKVLSAQNVDYSELVSSNLNKTALSQVSSRLGISDLGSAERSVVQLSKESASYPLFMATVIETFKVGAEDVQQQSWSIVDASTSRIYSIVCQFRPGERSVVTNACQGIVDSFVIE